MVSRRRNSKDVVPEKDSIFALNQILKNFAGINFPDSIFQKRNSISLI